MKTPIYYPLNYNLAVHYPSYKLLVEIFHHKISTKEDIFSFYNINEENDVLYFEKNSEDQGYGEWINEQIIKVFKVGVDIIIYVSLDDEDQNKYGDGDHFIIAFSWIGAMEIIKKSEMSDFYSDGLLSFLNEQYQNQ